MYRLRKSAKIIIAFLWLTSSLSQAASDDLVRSLPKKIRALPPVVRAESINGEVVSDIDWTLVYSIDALTPDLNLSRVIDVGGQLYRIADHVEEALLLISQVPGLRLSFFSGGGALRNRELLKAIKIKRNLTAYDLALSKVTDVELERQGGQISGVKPRVFSFEDLTQIKQLDDPFTLANGYAQVIEYFRKDLQKVLPHSGLKKIVLVDDRKDVVYNGEAENLLWLGETYNFVEDYDAFHRRQKTPSRYDPPDKESWFFERNKWAWILGIVLDAEELSLANNISFSQAMHLTRLKAAHVSQRWSYVNRGLRAMQKPMINKCLHSFESFEL